MKRSTEKILTTFVGSLARPADLIELLKAKESGQSYDRRAFEARVRGAVAEVVRSQAEAGVDIVSDGEQGKAGFINYITERLAGFEPRPTAPRAGPWAGSREVVDFPEYYDWYSRWRGASVSPPASLVCAGPISYKGREALQRDIENLKAALKGVTVEEAFLPATSPANVEAQRKNEYYPTEEAYLYAIAAAMREEYRAIVDGAAGYRNGYGKPRRISMMAGTIVVRRPRVRDLEERLESRILPLFKRRTEEVGEFLPQLYLHGLAQGDFELNDRNSLFRFSNRELKNRANTPLPAQRAEAKAATGESWLVPDLCSAGDNIR